MSNSIKIEGIDETIKLLMEEVPTKARNLMRAVIHGVASDISKDAKSNAPRKTGNLRKSIKAKRRKSHPDKPVSEVHVEKGKSKKNDGFYWRFIEYGTSGGPAGALPERPFMRPAKDKAQSNMPQILENQFRKKLQSAIKREQKKRAKR